MHKLKITESTLKRIIQEELKSSRAKAEYEQAKHAYEQKRDSVQQQMKRYKELYEKVNSGDISETELAEYKRLAKIVNTEVIPKLNDLESKMREKMGEYNQSLQPADKEKFKRSDADTVAAYGYDPNDPSNAGKRGLGT